MSWCPVAFYFCMSNPLSFLMCSNPFLACCIVVVVKLEMVFCRGNMRSFSISLPYLGRTVASFQTLCSSTVCVVRLSPKPHPDSSPVDPTQTNADAAVLRVFCTVLRCWSKWVGMGGVGGVLLVYR